VWMLADDPERVDGEDLPARAEALRRRLALLIEPSTSTPAGLAEPRGTRLRTDSTFGP
jgi:hypothetical protein